MVGQPAAEADDAFRVDAALSAVDPKTGRTVSRPEDLSGTHGTYIMYRLERKLLKTSCESCKTANTEMTTRYRRARGVVARPKPVDATEAKTAGGSTELARQRAAGTAAQQRARTRQFDVKPLGKRA